MVQTQNADQHQADGMVHLVLDRRVEGFKLLKSQLPFQACAPMAPSPTPRDARRPPSTMNTPGCILLLRWTGRFGTTAGSAASTAHEELSEILGAVGPDPGLQVRSKRILLDIRGGL